MAERITSLAALQAEKERLRQARALHGQRLQEHWTRVSDPEQRRGMVWSSVRSMFPQDRVSWQDLAAEGGRLAASSMAFRSHKARNKLFWMGLSLALPSIIRNMDAERMGRIATELRVSLDRLRTRFAKGREERQAD